uniref:RSN1_7TM domain-containing protein n=1 Tax=Ascaris lumbricoides TaxID=6252 RepID=A0A0M3IMY1_ASCLU
MGIISGVGYTLSLILIISLSIYPLVLCFRPDKKVSKFLLALYRDQYNSSYAWHDHFIYSLRLDGCFMGIISGVGYTLSLILIISLSIYPLVLCFRPDKKVSKFLLALYRDIEKKYKFMSNDDPKADSMYAVRTEIAFPSKKSNRKIDPSL